MCSRDTRSHRINTFQKLGFDSLGRGKKKNNSFSIKTNKYITEWKVNFALVKIKLKASKTGRTGSKPLWTMLPNPGGHRFSVLCC